MRLTLIFRKAKKVTRKPTKTAGASEASATELEGLSFVPTGPGQGGGGGIYYVDFSEEYKICLKRARDELEKESQLSHLEKKESKWVDEISQDRDLPIDHRLIQLKVVYNIELHNLINKPLPKNVVYFTKIDLHFIKKQCYNF